MPDKTKSDDTAGQVRRASDSGPRPGSGTPSSNHSEATKIGGDTVAKGDRKPSSSPSPLEPGRPTKK